MTECAECGATKDLILVVVHATNCPLPKAPFCYCPTKVLCPTHKEKS